MHYFHQMFGHPREVRVPLCVMVSWEDKHSTIPAAVEKFNSILAKKFIPLQNPLHNQNFF